MTSLHYAVTVEHYSDRVKKQTMETKGEKKIFNTFADHINQMN